MRKGDIFVYPNQKYYVEEVYENEAGEWIYLIDKKDKYNIERIKHKFI